MIAAIAVGAIAVLMVWLYLFETMRGVVVVEHRIFKKYINQAYYFSLGIMAVLWISTTEPMLSLMRCFWGFLFSWIFTAVVALLLSVFTGAGAEEKRTMRQTVYPCITKVVLLAVVVWLIY